MSANPHGQKPSAPPRFLDRVSEHPSRPHSKRGCSDRFSSATRGSAVAAAVSAALLAPASSGQESPTPLIDKLNETAAKIRAARASRCLSRPVFRWHPGYLVPEHMRAFVIRQRLVRLDRNRGMGSRCITWPWDALAECESGSRWGYNGPSGFDGGLQFHPGTWTTARGLVGVRYAYAWQAPAWVQVRVAKAWLARTSWHQWPACARKLGLL
jgi:hypothetical protein